MNRYTDAQLAMWAVVCEMEGMKAANDLRRDQGKAQAYGEEDFVALADRLTCLRESLQ